MPLFSTIGLLLLLALQAYNSNRRQTVEDKADDHAQPTHR